MSNHFKVADKSKSVNQREVVHVLTSYLEKKGSCQYISGY